jgi:DNA-directed RNA polymerase specialized sigma24 family protein
VLTIHDGLNHAEAAQILGCSETTVSWRVFTAKRKLKKLLTTGRSGLPASHNTAEPRAAIEPRQP